MIVPRYLWLWLCQAGRASSASAVMQRAAGRHLEVCAAAQRLQQPRVQGSCKLQTARRRAGAPAALRFSLSKHDQQAAHSKRTLRKSPSFRYAASGA